MSRYIDADALIASINTAFLSEIGKIIDTAPHIDIVRCKECRISAIEGDDEEGTHYMWCSWIGHEVNPDDFCSYGERKESEP